MKPTNLLALGLFVLPVLSSELPQIVEKPWLGQYAGYEKRSIRFLVNSKGEGVLTPPKEKKGFVSAFSAIKFIPLIEEVAANGQIHARPALADGWEAVTPASINPEKVTYRGTIKGGAKFEVNFEISGDEIKARGRVIEKGDSSNPLRFVMRVQVPGVYRNEKDLEKLTKRIEDDRIDLLRTDGKKLRLDTATPLDAKSAEFSGPGIAEARIEMDGYRGNKMELNAGPTGAFELTNRNAAALYKGFTLAWRHNAVRDPEGKGRLAFKMR